MEKKYKLTKETINVNGKTLYRIEAIKDFGYIKKGDKGGFVEKEENLSQRGNCWVYDNAQVCEDAKLYGDAMVCDKAKVCGNAEVYGNALVFDNARVYGNAVVCDYAVVCGKAWVFGNARIGLQKVNLYIKLQSFTKC